MKAASSAPRCAAARTPGRRRAGHPAPDVTHAISVEYGRVRLSKMRQVRGKVKETTSS